MVQIENLPLVLTGLGLTASILYYSMVLRNQNKTQQTQLETRRTQLFMNLFQTINTEESHRTWAQIMDETFNGYDDWIKKYDHTTNVDSFSKRTHLWYAYNCIGALLRDGVIDVELANNVVGVFVLLQWMKFGDLIKEMRVKQGLPRFYRDFEYLVDELMKFYKEHPEENHVNEAQYQKYISQVS